MRRPATRRGRRRPRAQLARRPRRAPGGTDRTPKAQATGLGEHGSGALRADRYSEATREAISHWDAGGGLDTFALIETVKLICDGGAAGEYGPGAVLVFMPGTLEIRRLVRDLEKALGARAWILPLHGALTGAEQTRVFRRPPAGKRKIVVSTNIAETSITIDDVVYVVDSGRVKEMQYDALTTPCLVETWTSRASAKQRQGRAGRVRNGFCFRMFPRRFHDARMAEHQEPEIRRVPLERLCLQISLLGLGDVRAFLARAIDPPDRAAVDGAIQLLQELQALDPGMALTPLGHHLARLPVDVRVGKMLVFGCVLGASSPA